MACRTLPPRGRMALSSHVGVTCLLCGPPTPTVAVVRIQVRETKGVALNGLVSPDSPGLLCRQRD